VGWIGARIQPVTDEIAEAVGLDKGRGAMIAVIDPASPAAQAKLQPGDVIISYDGKPIDRSRQLPRMVADTPPERRSSWRCGATVRSTRSSSSCRIELESADPAATRTGKAETAAERRRPSASNSSS